MRQFVGPGWSPFTLVTLLVALGGCGGSGNETNSAPSTTPAGGTTGTASVSKEGGRSAPADKAQGKPGELITPDRRVDTKSLIDVVKEEVKGGEAASGGSPENYLWLASDPKLIRDEPLTVDVPRGFTPMAAVVPASNPMTKGKFELGKQLYFDQRVSLNGTVSCATCHNPVKGWTDNLKTSVGIDGQVGGRNAPTVLNTAYGKTMFWDGRAPSLEGQAQGPIQNSIEMGKQSYKQIIERLRTIPGYQEQFRKVFGADVTLDGFAKAVATFERAAAISGDSAYDKYNNGDLKALSESQKRGMVLFGLRLGQDDDFKTDVVLKKADCTSCHAGFNFTDEQFHNLGVGWNGEKGRFDDHGRFVIEPIGSKDVRTDGSFKTPTVRDAEKTGPYMHDGSLKSLEEVVEHYNKGGNPNPALDKDVKKLNLTDREKADVVAFMKALTGEPRKLTLPTLPPGADGKSPNPADALAVPGPRTARNDVPHPPSDR